MNRKVTMTFHARLLADTKAAEAEFLAIPIINRTLSDGIEGPTYLAYLGEAYHHVRHTCPLLALAYARCREDDGTYREALLEYIDEERGHEMWILDDIRALGGDAATIARGRGGQAVRIMVGYAYYAIEHISPFALLGMVHVLEGVSAKIATQAAAAIQSSLGLTSLGGFSYLISHGALDKDHVAFFEGVVNTITCPRKQQHIIDTAVIMYRLFGNVFRDLESGKTSG